MSENSELEMHQPHEAKSSVPDIGAVLTEARERLGLSIEEAALQLRLGSRQVQALENNDYASLPGVTFVRGFLRNYARLLGLDPESLLQALRSHTQESAQQSISLHSEKIALARRDKKSWLSYAIASVLVGLILGGWMAYMDHREGRAVNPGAKTIEPVVEKPAVTEPVVAESAKVDPPQVLLLPTEQMTPSSTPQVAASEPPVKTATGPVAVAGNVRLKFIISQRTWIGVADRNDNEIFNKTKAAGSEDMVEGLPPFKISVGNAAGVQMTFNGKPVDLAPYTKGNVARLTLE